MQPRGEDWHTNYNSSSLVGGQGLVAEALSLSFLHPALRVEEADQHDVRDPPTCKLPLMTPEHQSDTNASRSYRNAHRLE